MSCLTRPARRSALSLAGGLVCVALAACSGSSRQSGLPEPAASPAGPGEGPGAAGTAGQPGAQPPPASPTAGAPAGPAPAVGEVALFDPVDDEQDLVSRAQGIALAKAELDQGGVLLQVCFTPERPVLSKPGFQLRPWCSAPNDVSGAGIIPPRDGKVWVAVTTGSSGDRLLRPYDLLAVHEARCQPGAGCGEAPLGSMARRARCAQIAAVWDRIPPAHRACQADQHCVLLSAAANCFHRALNTNAAGAYRKFLDDNGAGCLWARAGMCPPDPQRGVACRQGQCTVLPARPGRPRP